MTAPTQIPGLTARVLAKEEELIRLLKRHKIDSPVTQEGLAAALSLPPRMVRLLIRECVLKHYPVGATSDAGYFWAETAEQLEHTRAEICSRIVSLCARRDAIERTQTHLRCGQPIQEKLL